VSNENAPVINEITGALRSPHLKYNRLVDTVDVNRTSTWRGTLHTKRKKMRLERRPLHVPAHALTWEDDAEALTEQALAGLRRLAGRSEIENLL
jgi:hypothetical protein